MPDLPKIYNLVTSLGTDKAWVFRLRHKVVVATAAAANATSLTVYRIPRAIAAGSVLNFGGATATVSVTVQPGEGDTMVLPAVLSGAIAANAAAAGPAIDLSGYGGVSAWVAKTLKTGTAPYPMVGEIYGTPSDGLVRVRLTDSANNTLGSNVALEDLPAAENLQDKAKYKSKVWDARWYWYLNLVLGDGSSERRIQGGFFNAV